MSSFITLNLNEKGLQSSYEEIFFNGKMRTIIMGNELCSVHVMR